MRWHLALQDYRIISTKNVVLLLFVSILHLFSLNTCEGTFDEHNVACPLHGQRKCVWFTVKFGYIFGADIVSK